MQYITATQEDGYKLAEIRAAAMKPSLVALGRFDENRVRSRFLETFTPSDTKKIIDGNELLGFYVIRDKGDHIYLDHLYLAPSHQNKKLGKTIVERIVKEAHQRNLPVRLGALRGSRSNDFYLRNGFVKTHEDEFDIFYEYAVVDNEQYSISGALK